MSLLKKAYKGIGGSSGLGALIGGIAGGFAGNPVLGAELGSSIGGMFGPSADRLQRREDLYWYNKQNKDAIKFWQMQNEYNSPAAQAQRYLAAGMNPYLAQGTVGDAGNAGTISVASTPHHTISSGSRGERSMVKFFQNKQMESAENQNEAEMLKNEYYKLKNIQLADKIERDRKRGGAVLANKVRKDKPLTLSEAKLLNKIMHDASQPTDIKGSSIWTVIPSMIENAVYKAVDFHNKKVDNWQSKYRPTMWRSI